MSQAESKLSRDIMFALRSRGWFCFKIHGGPTMLAGLPDIIVCAEGYFIGLETKMPAKRENTSARQRLVHAHIHKAGGGVGVVCSAEEAIQVVQSFLKSRRKNDPAGGTRSDR